MELFTIECTTCRARLVVHDEAVIGDILACPKCSSMVHVVPPAGWNNTTVESAPQDPAVWPPTRELAAARPASIPRQAKSPQTKSPQPAPQQPSTPNAAKAKVAAAVIPPALPPRPASPPTVAASPAPVSVPPPVIPTAKVAGQPPLPTPAPAGTVVPPPVPIATAAAISSTKSVAKVSLTATRLAKLTNWARQEWKFLAGGVGTGIALGGTVWLVLAMQTPSTPLVAELPSDSAASVAVPAKSVPLPATDPQVGGTQAIPSPAVEHKSANQDLPSEPADKLAGEPQDPSAAAAPIAAPLEEPAPVDKPATAPPAPAEGQPVATEEKTPPVASAPQPTIKLEPAPVKPAATDLPPEAESILNTAAADAAADAPAAVRTPTAESPGAERPELTAAEVDERLSRALPAAQFTKVPLFQFVEFVAELSNLPIQLDEPALKRAGKSRQSAVTVKLRETTAGDALRAALSDLGLVTAIREGVVVVTVAPEANSGK